MKTRDKKITAMQQLHDDIVALTHSPLYSYRTINNYIPVLGEGSLDASIVFVGEAPGEKEAKSGRPFCGRSGTLLDEMLTSIHLSREVVYITNLVKDRPPENRDPTDDEIALYAPFLDRQLAIIQPKVIVMLGRISMKYLFTKGGVANELQPIGQMHGQVYKGMFEWGEATLLPLYHPAVALYNGSMRQVLFEDVKNILKYLK